MTPVSSSRSFGHDFFLTMKYTARIITISKMAQITNSNSLFCIILQRNKSNGQISQMLNYKCTTPKQIIVTLWIQRKVQQVKQSTVKHSFIFDLFTSLTNNSDNTEEHRWNRQSMKKHKFKYLSDHEGRCDQMDRKPVPWLWICQLMYESFNLAKEINTGNCQYNFKQKERQ